ncbi:MAG TPA: DUF4433 domain-containing protein [Phycisphaerales bacterium]
MPHAVPANPKIYHITHVDNLAGIASAGCLWSDRVRIDSELACSLVGMSKIKKRRLEEIEVDCHEGTKVGEYVPFYFCPRSIMLSIIYYNNHPELTYRGGQNPIVHLRADLNAVIDWAETHEVRWACSDRNAGAHYVKFGRRRADLSMVNWNAVSNTIFRDPVVKEGKQAEFLLYESFPWHLIEAIGVRNEAILAKVRTALRGTPHRPPVKVETSWYY